MRATQFETDKASEAMRIDPLSGFMGASNAVRASSRVFSGIALGDDCSRFDREWRHYAVAFGFSIYHLG